VSQMIGLTFNVNAKKEKRENAMITLLKLTRWRNDAYEIFIKEVREDDEVICSSIRIVAGLCKNNVNRIKSTMIKVVLPWCLEMMNSTSTERVNASQYCLQNVLNTYSGMNDEPDSKPNEALCMLHKKEIDTILSCLLDKIKNETTTGIARDALIEFITRNIHYTALDWAKQLIKFGGLQTLMKVASQLKEYQHESLLDITSSTQTITSVCLAKIYENLYNDYAKKFFDIITDFFGDELDLTTVTSNVRAIVAMTTLTFGPFNVANTFITEDGLADMIVDFLIGTGNDLLIRKVICEFIYAVVTKYDTFNTFIRRGFTILQDLCHLAPNDSKDPDNSTDLDNSDNLDNSKDSHDSENLKDSIRIRAFVGICKMTKFTVLKDKLQAVLTFDKEQIGTWLKVCIRFLTNSQRDMRKWAVEGLSYLTLDLGVKDDLIQDQQAVQAIIEFAKTKSQSILYQVDILLVNLCSAYDKDDFIIERERFVNYFNFDKDHIRAKDDYVEERRRVLAEAGVTSALVSLAKTGSKNSKKLIARVFNAICSQQDLRKMVVQEGGTETLLSLALNGTDIGKIDATRALVYLALTTSPEVAFPGQIIMEVVQPISNLLNPERSINERCDALTALCNLASVNNMREHIFKTEYEKIELCMRDNNNLLKRTSIQLINNLVLCRDVAIQLVKQRSDQLFDLMNRSVKDDTDDHTKK
ncbi:protein unc-45 homolog B-like, partial [Temnothorax curvispinosus]|uniref:Protein unc-45 homolog B-like n=1 Tax=Temnothorax curvispinosus TaxID=300111 RepID=A0A6J1QCN6_9HYME